MTIYVLVGTLFAGILLFAGIGCSHFSGPQGWSGGVIVDDALVIGSMDGLLLSLNKNTGLETEEWKPLVFPRFSGGKGGILAGNPDSENEKKRAIYGSPVVHEGIIYVASYDGVITAVNLENGEILDRLIIAEQLVGGVTFHDKKLFVGSSDGSMHALEVLRDGKMTRLWEWPGKSSNYEATRPGIWSSPATHNGTVFFGSLDHKVYGLDSSTGEEIWAFTTNAAVAASPVVYGGTVFVGSFDKIFYALNAEDGEEIWRFTGASNWYWGSAAVTEKYVLAPSLDGKLYALDRITGRPVWEFDTGSPIVGSPAIAKDNVVVASRDGDVYLLELDTGFALDKCPIDEKIETPMTIDGDAVYFGARDHTIRSLRIDRATLDEDLWPSPYFTDNAKHNLRKKHEREQEEKKWNGVKDEDYKAPNLSGGEYESKC